MEEIRLLIVEDDNKISDILKTAGEDLGFIVHTRNDKNLFISYDEIKPDVILLDLVMPENDGFEVLQFLQNKKCEAQIIIVSGQVDSFRSMAERFGNALGVFICGNVKKPFRVAELTQQLENAKNLALSLKRKPPIVAA